MTICSKINMISQAESDDKEHKHQGLVEVGERARPNL
jgi:hypothetical protein